MRLLAILALLAVQDPAAADLTALTRGLVEALMAGRTAPIVARFDEKMRAALPEAQLATTVTMVQSQAGAFKAVTATRTMARDGVRVVIATCDLSQHPVDVTVAYNADGRIVGLNLRPAVGASEYHSPPYASAERFTTSSVTVDAGAGWPLPGTLTLPRGDGPFPAVVLVHGSGPSDRDETIGPNKPFRDLAEGLASRGIAVLRYDKRTLVHRARISTLTTFTVKEETIDDALAAVALLRRTPAVRADRIFVAGHSLGGMLAPRIGAADPALGGLIVLAGAVRSLADSILSQTRYLAEADGTVTDDERTVIAHAEALTAKARTLKPGDPPLTGALASAPVSYLIDLNGYQPPAAARTLKMPMLILQGGRDYQVTMDDFATWRAALDGRPNVRLTAYPALNHLFIAGTGKSTPAEYLAEGHVDEAVVSDIAAWVAAR